MILKPLPPRPPRPKLSPEVEAQGLVGVLLTLDLAAAADLWDPPEDP